MNAIYGSFSASVSELKKNLSRLLTEAGGEPVVILNHNKPTAYLVPAPMYEEVMERLEDAEWGEVIRERMADKDEAIEVSLDEL
jgi:antitoxin StbD